MAYSRAMAKLPINISASGILIPAVSGKRIRVTALHIERDKTSTETVTLGSHDGVSTFTALTGALSLSFNDHFNGEGLFDCLLGQAFYATLSGSLDVDGYLSYTLI